MEVFANVALTDMKITPSPLTGAVIASLLIIGDEYFDVVHEAEL